ncbi:hypothetical protein BH10ACI2_BH10ACI2_22100 [soil metagenome]
MFKKNITVLTMALMLAVSVPMFSTSVTAQTTRSYSSRTRTYTTYKRPNVYRRHRKAFNIGIGTGVGMLVGGLIGGKKGVVIGGLGGAGGGALFTHVQRPKHYTRTYRKQ